MLYEVITLNIFPSLDTSVCATSVRKFNQQASDFDGVEVLCISKDLPFAHGRFCAAEGIRITSYNVCYTKLLRHSTLRGLGVVRNARYSTCF